MNILQLFRREAKVINDDIDLQVLALEQQDALELKAKAERLVREKREGEEYTAKIVARRDNYLREVETEMANVWRVMPELRWHLLGLRQLERRLDELGDGRQWEDVTGLPFGLADRLSTEIAQALAGTRLGQEAFTPGEVSRPNMEPVPARMIQVPRFTGDNAPPLGFSGTWNMIKGRPMQPGDEGY